MKITKENAIKIYNKLYKKHKGAVSLKILSDNGLTHAFIRHNFGSKEALDSEARKTMAFSDFKISDIVSNSSKRKVNSSLKEYKRFVITTAVAGCKVDQNALDAVRHYCKKQNAKLLILVCADPAKKQFSIDLYGTLDLALKDELIITQDTTLNSNLFLSTIKTTAKQIDPLTGLMRFGKREGSFIYASPKQRLQYSATSGGKCPSAIMTPGAITLPDYETERYLSERTKYIADYDHKMGAIIVEVVDSKIFHFRQVQFDKGVFIDLGVQWSKKESKKVTPEAFVLGDWHSGQTDFICKYILKQACKDLKPERLIIHDLFEGKSVSHHTMNNLISRAKSASVNKLSLKEELKGVEEDLIFLTDLTKTVYIIKSNHDEFLKRYLEEGRFIKDPQNYRLGLELSLKMLDGKDPLKEALTLPKNVVFIPRDCSLKLAGIDCGNHGDLGANGSKGNIKTTELSYGKAIVGHSHTPCILRDTWSVGTFTFLKMDYNRGASSWVQNFAIVYPNGQRQLINIIDEKYKMED